MRSTLSPYDEAHIGEILTGSGDWFSAKLIRLISESDANNREALRQAYPDHVAAYERWHMGEGPHLHTVYADEVTNLYDEIMAKNAFERTEREEKFIEYIGDALATEVERTS